MVRSSRLTIAGLMGAVLVASLGITALRSGSGTWAGVVSMLACGVLALAVVGVACGSDAERAWWLGFAVWGCGYTYLAFWSFENALPTLPTEALLRVLSPYVGPADGWRPGAHGLADNAYRQVGHSLFSLIAAALGGMLAHAFFSAPSAPSGRPGAGHQPAGRRPGRWIRRPAVLGSAVSILFIVSALAGSRTAPGLWTGTTVLLTWGVFGLAAIAAACGQGRRRASRLGFALFGAGYMFLVAEQPLPYFSWPQLTTNHLLNSVRQWLPPAMSEFPDESDGISFANARILKALDQPVPMRFPQKMPLEDVLKSIVAATRDKNGRAIPIHVEPNALEQNEATMQSPVTIDLEGVPLRTTLRLVLRQLGLSYVVNDGMILIYSDFDEVPPAYSDPFLIIGQCLLALLAAGLGRLLAPLVYDARDEAAERQASAMSVV